MMAMTGSYFRGDSVPVLRPEDEAKFQSVTYSYYEQLDGYEHLKSLGIRYSFYKGRYINGDPGRPRHRQEDDHPHPASRLGRGLRREDRRGRA